MNISASMKAAAVTILIFVGATSATAAEYTYRLIADNTGKFDGVIWPTALGDDGTAVFAGLLADSPADGVFAGNGTTLTRIVDTTGSLESVYPGGINADGMVGYWAQDATTQYVYKGDGATCTLIADTTGTFRIVEGRTISKRGDVAFWGVDYDGVEGLYVGDGTGIRTIVDSQGPFTGFWGTRSFDGGDSVVFYALRDDGRRGIYTSNGELTTTIADTAGMFRGFDETPDISVDGDVAFAGYLDCAGKGIYVSDGGSFTLIADDSGPYEYVRTPLISSTGTVAFFARLDTDQWGFFTGPDPSEDKIIQVGDTLLGATVVSLSPGDFNNRDELGFSATLSDGRQVITVATPVPEPATLCLIAFALVPTRRRHR